MDVFLRHFGLVADNVEHINKEVFKSAEALAQAQLADKHCMPALYVARLDIFT